MKIYTRTGDAGTTSLVGGKRVDKDNQRLEAYGTIDELNSHIGLLAAMPGIDADSLETLNLVQNRLFNIGAYLATDNTDTPISEPEGIGQKGIGNLERQMDLLTNRLPQLNSFILPGGTPTAAQAHVCRTVCRRAERAIVALSHQTRVADTVLSYINRLSDYLFTLARAINHDAGHAEQSWRQDI